MLTTQNLTYVLRGKHLIDNLSLHFEIGQVYGIIGPNGSGKTTFMKAVAGIWIPTSGSVKWQGKDLLSQSRQQISRTITLVPQNPQITFDFTVEEFVSMGRYAHGSKGEPVHGVEDALRRTDAWQFRQRLVNQLSQGERQRVYIARSLATEAPVMLFDEPIAHLDLRHQKEIWELLMLLAKQGKIIIVSNHDLINTEKYCDSLYLLHEGRYIAGGPFQQVITPHTLSTVFCVSN